MIKKEEEKNKTTNDEPAKQAEKDVEKKPYIYAVGRRKRAIATVRLYNTGKGDIIVNTKDFMEYFPTFDLQRLVHMPLKAAGLLNKHDITIKVNGGGVKGQAEAVRLGITRALIKLDIELRKTLKSKGYLSRDAREKERKKPGLKRARRAPQWSKR